MGFKDARDRAIRALEDGTVQHEARDDIDDKNLLLTGEITPAQVVKLLKACKGTQYTCSPHHSPDVDVDVHTFKPQAPISPGARRQRWYIKLYFLDPDAWFISVHR